LKDFYLTDCPLPPILTSLCLASSAPVKLLCIFCTHTVSNCTC